MADRPTILVVIKGLGIGGAEKLISEGARFWDRDRFDYHVAYVLPWKNQLVPDLEALGVPVHCVGGARGLTPMVPVRIQRLVGLVGADIVHIHSPAVAVGTRLTVLNRAIVYTEHNVSAAYHPLTRLLNRATYRRNSRIIAVSKAVADSVQLYSPTVIDVVPNGVAEPTIDKTPSAIRAELGIPASSPLVVHVGNIKPAKDHANLIAAGRELRIMAPDAHIVSIGAPLRPEDLERLRAEVIAAGIEETFHLLGSRPSAAPYLNAADVVVNPSLAEGLPVALLEAMVLGRPIVATAVGGVPTIIEHDVTGLLVRPSDPLGLATAVADLLADPERARDLGLQAKRRVEEEFSLQTMVARVEEIYEAVMRDRSSRASR